MTLVNLSNLHKSYGDVRILSGVSMQVFPGDRIGLVGSNGAGKTTLLRIIAGEETADNGQVLCARDLIFGYLTQRPGALPGMTLFDFLKEPLQELFSIREKLSALEQEMASPYLKDNKQGLNALMKKYGELAHRYEAQDGYFLEKRLESVARGLGFSDKDLSRRVSDFSGGEKTRAQLSSLLLNEYDLLLLDEPTNNLDTESVEWLERFLTSLPGALLVVSHDRYFLDRIVNHIAVLDNRTLKLYRGNYTAYAVQKHAKETAGEKAFKKQQSAIKKDLNFIRNASSDEKRRAQSREKRLEKMKAAEHPHPVRSMNPRFGFSGRSGKIAASFDRVTKSFGSVTVIKDFSWKLFWGDRVAVVGPNGAGKTTLMRMITGEETPDAGTVTVGPGVKMAYFDQNQDKLNLSDTVLENILNSSGMTEPEARKYLGGYLFRGDDVFKKASTLSGGEKSRLSLALTTLSKGNLLVLDEPTNYLDIGGMEQLESSLADYPGTLLLVSHDRFFISRIATRILEFRNGRATLYPVSYPEYMEIKEKDREKTNNTGSEQDEIKNKNKRLRQEQREQEKQKRREIMALRRKRRDLAKSISSLEECIQNKENVVTQLEKKLSEPDVYADYGQAREIMEQLNHCRKTIREMCQEWEDMSEKLEQMPRIEI